MRVFLKETSIEERNNINGLEQPMILKLETDDGDGINPIPSNKIHVAKIPSPRDIYRLLKTRYDNLLPQFQNVYYFLFLFVFWPYVMSLKY